MEVLKRGLIKRPQQFQTATIAMTINNLDDTQL